MECSEFRQTWEPATGVAESARRRHHSSHCAACRQWQAEQVAVDAWLRASLRAVIDMPAAPALRDLPRPYLPRPLSPQPSVLQDLAGGIGYAVAAALAATAMLGTAVQPLLDGAAVLGG